MYVQRVEEETKQQYMDLLLLADEAEDMIRKYLFRGDLFALYDGDLISICVVTDEGDGIFELKKHCHKAAIPANGLWKKPDYVCGKPVSGERQTAAGRHRGYA